MEGASLELVAPVDGRKARCVSGPCWNIERVVMISPPGARGAHRFIFGSSFVVTRCRFAG
jgi:hypothetical protein